jgi:hypothetical protein
MLVFQDSNCNFKFHNLVLMLIPTKRCQLEVGSQVPQPKSLNLTLQIGHPHNTSNKLGSKPSHFTMARPTHLENIVLPPLISPQLSSWVMP